MKKTTLLMSALVLLTMSLTACNFSMGSSGDESGNPSDSGSSGGDVVPTFDDVDGNFTFKSAALSKAQKIHTTNQEKYLNYSGNYYHITKDDLDDCGATGTADNSAPLQVTVEWDYTAPSGKTVSNYSFTYGQKSDLSDGYKLPNNVTAKSVKFYNPYLGDNYFKVTANFSDGSTEDSSIKVFKVDGQAPRNLKVGNLTNIRDHGGRTTLAGGKIKQGLIYRTCGNKYNTSDSAGSTMNSEAKEVLLHQMKVKTEINVSNDNTYNFNMTSDGVAIKNAYMSYGSTPYSNFARNAERIRQVFEILADQNNYPVFYHCRIGTDRTGITGICINGLLGVPFQEILQDYGFSNFGNIGGQRYANKPSDPDGDDCAKYVDEILKMPGATFQEQMYNSLLSIGLSAQTLNSVIDIMTEGTKATLPTTAKIGMGSGLTANNATRGTNSNHEKPSVYYTINSGKSVSYTDTFTNGEKDIVVYLGSTNSSDSTKLVSCITLKIDGTEQTIVDKTLYKAGFGTTKQGSRTGYMFNLLGKFSLTAGSHTIEVAGKNSTSFDIGAISVFDHVAPAA